MTHNVETANYKDDADTLHGVCAACGKEVQKLYYMDRDDDKFVNGQWRTVEGKVIRCEAS